MSDPLLNPANLAYMQTAYLVEVLLDEDREAAKEGVKAAIGGMPGEQIMPLLGTALIFASEAMRDHFGTAGALDQIAQIRRKINTGDGFPT